MIKLKKNQLTSLYTQTSIYGKITDKYGLREKERKKSNSCKDLMKL